MLKDKKYRSGTYFNASVNANADNGHEFVITVIDDYGNIAGVHIDETCSNKIVYLDSGDNLYYHVKEKDGPSSYRKINLLDENYINIFNTVGGELIDGVNRDQRSQLSELVLSE